MRARQVAGFLLRFILVYALLMAPWPGLFEAYGSFYRLAVQIVVISSDSKRSVAVVHRERSRRRTAGALDTEILTRISDAAPDAPPSATRALRSSLYTGYAPTALSLALILATPLPWRRRAAALCWGGLLVTLFVALMPALQVYEAFDRQENHLLFEYLPGLYPAWKALLHALSKIGRWVTPYYVIPTIIWLFVAFRREDWMPIVEQLTAIRQPGRDSRG